MKNTWYYLNKEDIEFFKDKVSDKLYYQLLHQSLKRIPILKESYESLKKKYEKNNHSESK